MALINDGNPTLLDLAKRTDPNGSISRIVESLTKRNPLLQDMSWMEGNLPTGHRFTHRTGLPAVNWRAFNEGVSASKSRTNQIDESCGMLEGKSTVDVELAKLNGNEAAYRASEDSAFVQSMNNQVEESLFYSSTKTAPQQIMGLSPRLDATSGNPAASQIVKMDASASGADQTSIWFIVWSPETVFGIVPKGSQAGLQSHDMGVQMVPDANGNTFRAYQTVWNWKLGLCVKDYRYVVRLCNVDTGNLLGTGKALITKMVQAYHRLQDTTSGRVAIYANREVATYLHLQALDSTSNSTFSIEKDIVNGGPVTKFLGAPIRIADTLLNTEAVVS